MEDLLIARQELLPRRIHYLPEQVPDRHNEKLKQKYVPINRLKPTKDSQEGKKGKKNAGEGQTEGAQGLAYVWAVRGQPRVVLSEADAIDELLAWKKVGKIGCGLRNIGNTCFLNSSLQCLAYSAPLAQFALAKKHSSTCTHHGFCMMCHMERVIVRMHGKGQRDSFVPKIAAQLRAVSRNFRHGRQEDAHEFIHFVLEHLLKNSVKSEVAALRKAGGGAKHVPKKLTPVEAETSFIGRMFNGIMQSQVRCMNKKCGYESNSYESFLDLSLEIHGGHGSTLEKALRRFCHVEVLDADNMYKCSKCSRKSQAHKQLTFMHLPAVLVVHLKRFDGIHSKITKSVAYPQVLTMDKYLSRHADKSSPYRYQLSGVLIHLGHSQHSGHYFCYVRNSAGLWYEMDDETVQRVSEKVVMKQQAYLLFYTRVPAKGKKKAPKVKASKSTNQAVAAPLAKKETPVKRSGEEEAETGEGEKMKEVTETTARPWKQMNGYSQARPVVGKKRSREDAFAEDKESDEEDLKREKKKRKKSAGEGQKRTILDSAPKQKWDQFVSMKGIPGSEAPVSAMHGTSQNKAWTSELAAQKRLAGHSHFGGDVRMWAAADNAKVAKQRAEAAKMVDEEMGSGMPTARDKWDREYDKPKVKKVREKKVSLFDNKKANAFQDYMQKRKSLQKRKAKNLKAKHASKIQKWKKKRGRKLA